MLSAAVAAAAKDPLSCHLIRAISISPTARAPATATVPPRASTNPIAITKAIAVLAGIRRGPHKGKVDVDGLVEQLGVVGAVDGGASFLKRGVLDQRVTLGPTS